MIEVQGLQYSIDLVPSGLMSNVIGQTDIDQQEVLISATIPEQKQRQVLIHELTHLWINWEGIINILGPDDAESLVCRLANNIYATLVTNNLLADDWWDRIIDSRAPGDTKEIKMMNVTEKNAHSDPIQPMDGAEEDPISGSVRNEGFVGEPSRVYPR